MVQGGTRPVSLWLGIWGRWVRVQGTARTTHRFPHHRYKVSLFASFSLIAFLLHSSRIFSSLLLFFAILMTGSRVLPTATKRCFSLKVLLPFFCPSFPSCCRYSALWNPSIDSRSCLVFHVCVPLTSPNLGFGLFTGTQS